MALLPEWRHDSLTGRRVLISPARGERPHLAGPACPFCEGHEAETPPEVHAVRSPGSIPNGPGWDLRVVPNRYAAVRLDLPAKPEGQTSPGIGIAEVFIECPQHTSQFRDLPADRAALVLRSWRDRLRFWSDDGRIASAQCFKNEGPNAGASVEHCHSQLIGVDFIPRQVEEELRVASAHGQCRFCDWLTDFRDRATWVAESDHFLVFCPHAPRFPGETWLLPRNHEASFENLTDGNALELAELLQDLLRRLHRAFDGPDFNVIVKSAPYRSAQRFHWRLEVLPRLSTLAGFEFGTGLMINTLLPEAAASQLRHSRADTIS